MGEIFIENNKIYQRIITVILKLLLVATALSAYKYVYDFLDIHYEDSDFIRIAGFFSTSFNLYLMLSYGSFIPNP